MTDGVPASPRERRRLAATVLVVGVLMNLLARGLAESFAVFLLPLGEAFATDRAAVTAIYSTYMLVYGVAAPFTGAVIDRLGARVCYAISLVLFALAYQLAGLATEIWQLYLLLGVLSGVASAGLGMVPASVLASRWFDRRLPSAMSALYASLGVGALLFAPFSQWLVVRFGWRGAYHGLGALAIALLPLTVMLPWRAMLAGDAELLSRRVVRGRAGMAEALRTALRSRHFWALFGVLFFTSVTTYTVTVQLVAFLVETGVKPLLAASVYGALGMLSVVGMMVTGMMAERLGERIVATLSYTSTIAGIGCLALLAHQPHAALLGAFALLFGSMSGSRGPLVAVLSTRLFPGNAQATIYGFVLAGMGGGGALGAWLAGALHDWTGHYQGGFAVAAFAALCGLLLFRWLASPASGTADRR